MNQVSIDMNLGTLNCILGHNGAGKSTLINILSGIHQSDQGEIYWEGKNFHKMKKSLHIGICPSFNVLFDNLTVYEHLKVKSYFKNCSSN